MSINHFKQANNLLNDWGMRISKLTLNQTTVLF